MLHFYCPAFEADIQLKRAAVFGSGLFYMPEKDRPFFGQTAHGTVTYKSGTRQGTARCVSLKYEEMDEGDCRYGKAVIGEKSKRRLVEEFKEPENGNVSYRKRGDKADGNHGKVAAAEIVKTLQEVIETGNDHNRHGDNK